FGSCGPCLIHYDIDSILCRFSRISCYVGVWAGYSSFCSFLRYPCTLQEPFIDGRCMRKSHVMALLSLQLLLDTRRSHVLRRSSSLAFRFTFALPIGLPSAPGCNWLPASVWTFGSQIARSRPWWACRVK